MTEQLPLDFSASAVQRHRRAQKAIERAETKPLSLFETPPNLDIHLHSAIEAVATISGDPDRAIHFLQALVGPVRVLKTRRVAFPAEALDRVAWVRPPIQITLDAAAAAVARALWASKLGLRPLRVERQGRRLVAFSHRWPPGLRVIDAPWTAIAVLTRLGIDLDVADRAKKLMLDKLGQAGAAIAQAGLAGSAVAIEARVPELLEALELPGLSYAGEPSAGLYRMPLLNASVLLDMPQVTKTPDLVAAIKRTSTTPRPLKTDESFPWTLFAFQGRDAARGLRILETTGGVLLAGDMGSGKGRPLSGRVLTPTGHVLAGDVRVGDYLVGKNGKPTRVLAVYPQGLQNVYEVSFTDGTATVVDGEHLWSVNTPLRKDRGRPWLTKSTNELMSEPLRDGPGNLRWQIPVCDPVQFASTARLPVDPYLLGVLLGDGSMTQGAVSLASADQFIVDEVSKLLPAGAELVLQTKTEAHRQQIADERGVDVSQVGDYSYRVRGARELRDQLEALGVYGKRAWEKVVPDAYLYASEEDRRALLQGLLDTDGGPAVRPGKATSSSIEFTSTSEALADAVVFLVQSLGGLARKSKPVCKSYRYKGEKKWGRPSWRLSLAFPAGAKPFRLPRKADCYVDRVKYQPSRAIASIEPAGREETVCFKVAAEDELYLLDHCIVTHNTTVSLALVHELELWPLLVVAPLSAFSTWARQLEQMGRTFYLATEAPKIAWEKIEARDVEAVVISYDRLHAFSELIERVGFRAVVADEVQRIRTPGSRRSRALRALASAIPYRIGLSGTPLTNTVNDLLPLGAFLVPGEWRPRANSKDLDDMYPGDPIEGVAEHLGSMMVRRRMEDTGAKLPKRNDHRVYIELTPEQRRALTDLEEEAMREKEEGAFDDNGGRMHAFAKLQRMRQIVNCPSAAGVGGPNPKVIAALDLAEDFLSMGRKGVIFCADRTTFKELSDGMKERGIGHVCIWGSTPPHERIANEKKFHSDPDTKVVLCTIQAGSESWSASPTGTWLISTSYMYAPSTLSQMEARVHRMNSDPDGPEIEIMYTHASVPGGSLDDRIVEILALKKELFAQVVDRSAHVDGTKVHYSMSDLVYLMTGERDEKREQREKDAKKAVDREQAKKEHAKKTLYRNKGKNKRDASLERDTGEQTLTWEEYSASVDEIDELLDAELEEGAFPTLLPDDDGDDDAAFDSDEDDASEEE